MQNFYLNKKELNSITEVFKNIFDTDIGRQIKEIEFCGTVDEPGSPNIF